MDQRAKAETFKALHHTGEILVLPNAWDAASAAIMADGGAKAVATSSAAVAWAHGWPDGDALPMERVLATVSSAAKAAGDVPLTADFEGGYTDDLGAVGENVRKVIEAGAVGINLEDGRRDAELHGKKIAAVRKAAEAAGVPLFINARTDVYLKGLAEGHAAFTETVERGKRYADAGADGFFVPFAKDDDLIGRIADAVSLPLNIMLVPGLSNAARLQALGVRRLSAGGSPFAATYAPLVETVKAYLATGEAKAFAAGAGLPAFNKRFAGG